MNKATNVERDGAGAACALCYRTVKSPGTAGQKNEPTKLGEVELVRAMSV
jgi:hypothetical protein